MAKARIIPEEEAEEAQEAQDFAALNQASGGDLFAAVDELRTTGAGDVVFIVNRLLPVESKGYCGKIPIAKFDLEMMKSLYGPGRYMVQIKGPKGFLPGGGPVEIAPTPEVKAPGTDMSGYLDRMDRRESERRARFDDWVKLAMASAAPIIAAWVSRPASGTDVAALAAALKPAPGPSLADLSTAMVNMKTLSAPPENAGTVDTVLKVFEAAQSMMGDREDSGKPGASSWVDVIRDLIKSAPEAIKPMLEARMAAMQAARGTAPPPVQPMPAPAIAPALKATGAVSSAGNAQGQSETDMLQWFMPMIKTNLAKVASWAEKDRDPGIYAEVLIDELPDNFGSYLPLAEVLNYLNHPQWFETIIGIEPKLQNHREWCDECRHAVIEIMKTFESDPNQLPPTAETPASLPDEPMVNTAEN